MARIRKDLFGCIDIVACKVGVGTIGVQTTSASNISSHIKKAVAEPRLKIWIGSGNQFVIHGWKKRSRGGRQVWVCDERPIQLVKE